MHTTEMLRLQLNHLVTQARQDIYQLSTLNEQSMKSQILQRLWDAISSLHFLSELLIHQVQTSYPFQPSASNQLGTANLSQLPQNMLMQPNSQQQPNLQVPPITPLPNQYPPQTNQRIFTAIELAAFNGKNGMPAYVAVNGIVYDVTNNRAWAAATHFSLPAGRDYSKEFASCHAGQQSILTTLPIVGRLV